MFFFIFKKQKSKKTLEPKKIEIDFCKVALIIKETIAYKQNERNPTKQRTILERAL